jgi:two-component system, OmpR family, alkaline phosphatase synthesis response regulator PhoP
MSLKTGNRILVVDDDPDIVELLQYNLEKEGYLVETAFDGRQAIDKAKVFLPELVILDVMMPHMDGIEAGREIKLLPELKKTFLLYLTARNEEYSEIAAFEIGADDYLTKPIKPRALMSRIGAFFRREATKGDSADLIEIAGLQINKLNYSVVLPNKTEVVLPRKEFELLFFLAQKPNKVFSRDEILQKIWGIDVFVVERTIDVHIRKVREKIGEDYIKTIKGVGYLFVDGIE